MKKLPIIIMLLIALTGWGLVAYSVTTAAPFDHSNCQYPYRATNPPDGCDNSDPACPLEVKGGSCEVPVEQPVVEPAVEQTPVIVETCKQ